MQNNRSIVFIVKEPLSNVLKKYWWLVTYFSTVILFTEYASKKHLSIIKNKINNNENYAKVEALDILYIVCNCGKKNKEALNKICELLPKRIVNN